MPNLKDINLIPHNYQAEKAYISCLFQEPSLIYTTPIKLKHIYDNHLKKIYHKMLTLKKEDITIDTFILWDEFDDNFLYDVASLTMNTNQFDDYVTVILEHYNRRKIQKTAHWLQNACSSEDEFSKITHQVSKLIQSIEWTEKVKTLIPWIFETIENFQRKDDCLKIWKTWFPKLDELIGWYRPWAFYLLGARPWMGKSTFMMNAMLRANKQGLQSCIFSLEMIDTEIHTRIMCCLWQVEQATIDSRDPEMLQQIADKVAAYGIEHQCNIYDDVKYLEDIERWIIQEASMWTKVIYIDYVQLIKTKSNYGSTNARLEEISSTLKGLAQKYRIAIFWLAQLNRSLEKNKIPWLQHLRGSGGLEQDVDVCLMLHDIKNEFGDPCSEDEARIDIVKNRQGQQWYFVFEYIKPYFIMRDI